MRATRIAKSITNGALKVQVYRKAGKQSRKTFACSKTDRKPRAIKVFKFDTHGQVESIALVKPQRPRYEPRD